MDAPDPSQVEPSDRRGLARGWLVLGLALSPALMAIAWVPEFSTQDGPAHLYNARILNDSFRASPTFSETFAVAWRVLPNWSGHLATMLVVALMPADLAGRAVTTATLVLFSASILRLRGRVAGHRGGATAALLAALLGLNVTWLLGFTSFLLGASLLPITLAAWWDGRQAFGPGRAAGLAGFLVLGYFCHPISLGLTLAGLGLLAALTSGTGKVRRAVWTASSLVPLTPFMIAYRAMSRSAGAYQPIWGHLENSWSPQSWAGQFGWVDPLSLAARSFRPFHPAASQWNILLSPALWTLAGFGLLALSTLWSRVADRRGWLVLAGLLLIGGLLGPDTLGVKHGHYLPQRVALLGLVALVPWLDLGWDRRATRWASGLLLVALLVQSAFVWEYALDCRDRLGLFSKAGPAIAPGRRIGTLLAGIKGRFRANPMLHADSLFGVRSDVVVWNNYETSHYYFPVKFRAGLDHPPALAFEEVAILDGPGEGGRRARRWEGLLDEHGRSIDQVVEWGPRIDPALEAITARDYRPTFVDGPVRVWTRLDLLPPGQGVR